MEFSVRTSTEIEFIDITPRLENILPPEGKGALLVFIPHTTAGVTVNEGADPDVRNDIIRNLKRLAWGEYNHREGNGPAHLQASLLGSSELIPYNSGKLELGTWQKVFLCEFDGPRSRKIKCRLLTGVGEDE